MEKQAELTLFGGDKGWHASEWTASDDRVRGGKSQSYLETSTSTATFHGTLDIKTLGGAGFASQRTAASTQTWDLSSYTGIRINYGASDKKRYTLILKDSLLPPNPENGREQATVNYEYDFKAEEGNLVSEEKGSFVYIKWNDLTPTYRGKEKKGAKKLDTKNVKRFSVMMRSFFGNQEGDFELEIKSIKAVSIPEDEEKGMNQPSADGWLAEGWRPRLLAVVLGITFTTYAVLSICPKVIVTHLTWPWKK